MQNKHSLSFLSNRIGRLLSLFILFILCFSYKTQAESLTQIWENSAFFSFEKNNTNLLKTESFSTCRMSDSLALVALYNSTNGANWTNTWDLNQEIDTWYGVTLDSSGCVICVALGGTENCNSGYGNGNNLVGILPAELGNLSELRQLWLGHNQLIDSIPAELGNLLELRYLILSDNELSGNIPSTLGNLELLTELQLQSNGLTGTIPTELNQLTNLKRLNLSNNQLTGSIPTELGELNVLENLNLGQNQLTGTIPTTLTQLTQLKWFYLNNNQLTGTIPVEIENMTSLYWLVLNNNELTGNIPNELGELSDLSLLRLANNHLSGTIPNTWNTLSNLKYLYLNNNELTGPISANIDSLSDLRLIDLSYNQLSGVIPSTFGNLTELTFMRLNHNNLTGQLPAELGNLTNLSGISLQNNQLEGCFPESYQTFCSIYYDFSNNPFLFEGGDFDLFCMEEGCFSIPVERVHLMMEDICDSPNMALSLPITVLYFDAISSIQFSLHIDTTVAQITGLSNFGINGLDSSDFNIDVEQGLITVNWTANNENVGETLANNATLFDINLQLVDSLGSSTTAYFDNIPTPIQLETTGSPIHVRTSTAIVCISNGFVVGGQMVNSFGEPILNTSIYTHGLNTPNTETQSNSIFELGDIEPGTFLSIEPYKNDYPQDGLTEADAAAIKAHIRSVNPFNNPYQVIAGDVDDSQHVSVLDAIHIKRLLQGETTNFPSEETWKFVPASHQFNDDNQPFPFPEILIYPTLYQDFIDQNFIGMKLGDVD